MKTHDPLCPRKECPAGPDMNPVGCQCRLIARVRADEQAK